MALYEDVIVELGPTAAKSLILSNHGPGPCLHCRGTGKCTCPGCHHQVGSAGAIEMQVECVVCGGTGKLAAARQRRSA